MAKAAKVKSHRVPRTHDNNTKTKAEFYGKFRSAIRKIWMYSGIRRAALNKQKVAPNRYLCEHCSKIFKGTDIEVNHKDQCGSLSSFEDFTPFVTRMFNEDLNNYEVLCKPCHQIITNEQKHKQ